MTIMLVYNPRHRQPLSEPMKKPTCLQDNLRLAGICPSVRRIQVPQ